MKQKKEKKEKHPKDKDDTKTEDPKKDKHPKDKDDTKKDDSKKDKHPTIHYVQLDGEPWKANKGEFIITRLNQATVLIRSDKAHAYTTESKKKEIPAGLLTSDCLPRGLVSSRVDNPVVPKEKSDSPKSILVSSKLDNSAAQKAPARPTSPVEAKDPEKKEVEKIDAEPHDD